MGPDQLNKFERKGSLVELNRQSFSIVSALVSAPSHRVSAGQMIRHATLDLCWKDIEQSISNPGIERFYAVDWSKDWAALETSMH